MNPCCPPPPDQAVGMAFFASTKVVKIDPELSMLVKHLISNSYAEFTIRLLSAQVRFGRLPAMSGQLLCSLPSRAELLAPSPALPSPCLLAHCLTGDGDAAQGASRPLTLVLTATAVKIKLEGETQIKDGYNSSFKVILSNNRLNTFVLQLSEVCAEQPGGCPGTGEGGEPGTRRAADYGRLATKGREVPHQIVCRLTIPVAVQETVLPMAVEHIYERDLVALTARGFWAIAMSRPQVNKPAALPGAEQLARAYAKRQQRAEKVDIWKDHAGAAVEPGGGRTGVLQAAARQARAAAAAQQTSPPQGQCVYSPSREPALLLCLHRWSQDHLLPIVFLSAC